MSYLLTQMMFYLLGALLLGLLLGWILWGRRGIDGLVAQGEIDRLRDENNQLRRNLETCTRARTELEGRIAETQSAESRQEAAAVGQTTAGAMRAPPQPQVEPGKDQPAAALVSKATKPSRKAVTKGAPETRQATTATVARSAKAAPAKKPKPVVRPDDLRRIIGIGPVNERLLHGEGVRTFAQIALWSADDVKRIEALLQFDGRIDRERWIEQSKLLAAGDEAEFAKRFPTAGSGKNT